MKKGTVSFVAAYFLIAVSLCLAQGNADTILYNGKILTVDSDFTIVFF